MTMRIFARFARRRKRLPADTAQSRVYGFALRQIEARRAMGLVYPDQYPDERHETDRYRGRAS
jgi:hypothetical protein